jgi:hypothetical protein
VYGGNGTIILKIGLGDFDVRQGSVLKFKNAIFKIVNVVKKQEWTYYSKVRYAKYYPASGFRQGHTS